MIGLRVKDLIQDELIKLAGLNLENLFSIVKERSQNLGKISLDVALSIGFKEHPEIKRIINKEPIPGTTTLGNLCRLVYNAKRYENEEFQTDPLPDGLAEEVVSNDGTKFSIEIKYLN